MGKTWKGGIEKMKVCGKKIHECSKGAQYFKYLNNVYLAA